LHVKKKSRKKGGIIMCTLLKQFEEDLAKKVTISEKEEKEINILCAEAHLISKITSSDKNDVLEKMI